MRPNFYLFQSHLDLAHQYWTKLVCPGDCVIDATCGNGQDTLKLAQLALTDSLGSLYACDIQAKAIGLTNHYLATHLSTQQFLRVHLIQGCHSTFPSTIQPDSVKLIVYNLGYLPGGDKSLTTRAGTTLQSFRQAQQLVMKGGAISLTCYPGHQEGSVEEEAILSYASGLDAEEWELLSSSVVESAQGSKLIAFAKATLIEPRPVRQHRLFPLLICSDARLNRALRGRETADQDRKEEGESTFFSSFNDYFAPNPTTV